jgi:isopentenyldiphosphate isomerase
MLHRAFSVFLFTPEGKLILQQVGARHGCRVNGWLAT